MKSLSKDVARLGTLIAIILSDGLSKKDFSTLKNLINQIHSSLCVISSQDNVCND